MNGYRGPAHKILVKGKKGCRKTQKSVLHLGFFVARWEEEGVEGIGEIKSERLKLFTIGTLRAQGNWQEKREGDSTGTSLWQHGMEAEGGIWFWGEVRE